MGSKYKNIDWENILRLLDSYNGTKKSFCNEHNITIHQLYHYRKKYGLLNKDNKSKDNIKDNSFVRLDAVSPSTHNISHSTIKVEIGKATLHIEDTIDESTFSTIVKVLIASC